MKKINIIIALVLMMNMNCFATMVIPKNINTKNNDVNTKMYTVIDDSGSLILKGSTQYDINNKKSYKYIDKFSSKLDFFMSLEMGKYKTDLKDMLKSSKILKKNIDKEYFIEYNGKNILKTNVQDININTYKAIIANKEISLPA